MTPWEIGDARLANLSAHSKLFTAGFDQSVKKIWGASPPTFVEWLKGGASTMERTTLDNLATKAEISRNFTQSDAFSRTQRLGRWSELLARQPHRLLNTFPMTEYMAAQVRDGMRCADSAITVAFEDPVLREEGLTDDSYGTAKRFFGLSDRQMHWIVCYCQHGMSVRAGVLATVVRSTMPRMPRAGVFGWLRQVFAPRAM